MCIFSYLKNMKIYHKLLFNIIQCKIWFQQKKELTPFQYYIYIYYYFKLWKNIILLCVFRIHEMLTMKFVKTTQTFYSIFIYVKNVIYTTEFC